MRTVKMMFLGAAVALSMGAAQLRADVASDTAAALLIWPDIKYESGVLDTIVQVSNTSLEPILLHCFYVNANSHCSNSGAVCTEASDCCGSGGCGICQPGWLETDFRIRLTPRQPLGWLASEGLANGDLPLDGSFGNSGIGGANNAGTRIPPVAEEPYTGVLKCIAINDDGTPTDRNVLKGENTVVHVGDHGDVTKHNAIGIQAIEGAVNDDKELVLGGGDAEYHGCPNYLIVNHMFDLGNHPITGEPSLTNIVLVPCTQDFLRQTPGRAVIQFLVYNEFEQRFSTSRTADCKADWRLSEIDTTDPTRSIFSAGVSGTLVGQSRLNPIGSGFIGIANEEIGDDSYRSSFNIHQQGDRAESDLITIP